MSRPAVLAVLLSILLARGASAGDVTVTANGGNLKLKGSPTIDVVVLTQPNGNIVRVTPQGGTTVNGSLNTAAFAVTGGISATLGDGSDALTLDGLEIAGSLSIKTGKGLDYVHVEGIIDGATKIDLGADDNALALCDADLRGGAVVKSGKPGGGAVEASCPMAQLHATSGAGSAILVDRVFAGKGLNIKAGRDTGLTLANTSVVGKTTIKTSGTGNGVAICSVTLGDAAVTVGSDPTDFASAGCIPLTMVNVQGNSALTFGNVEINGDLKVKLGAGDDPIALYSIVAHGKTKIDAGKGLDILAADNVSFASFSSKFGNGDDLFTWNNVVVSENATMKLGGGGNLLTLISVDIFGDLTIKAGAGNDEIDASGATVAGTTSIDAGKGANLVAIP